MNGFSGTRLEDAAVAMSPVLWACALRPAEQVTLTQGESAILGRVAPDPTVSVPRTVAAWSLDDAPARKGHRFLASKRVREGD